MECRYRDFRLTLRVITLESFFGSDQGYITPLAGDDYVRAGLVTSMSSIRESIASKMGVEANDVADDVDKFLSLGHEDSSFWW